MNAMKREKRTKEWLTCAAVLLILGALLFAAVMTAYRWDFTRLGTGHFVTNTYEIAEDFSSIRLDVETSDIILKAQSGTVCKVVCHEPENRSHSVGVKNDTLTVLAADNRERKWYDYIGIGFDSPKITVYLPKTEYSKLVITGSTGDVEIPKELSFDSIDVSLSTGDVGLFAASAGEVTVKTSTGDILASGTEAEEMTLCATTGDVTVLAVTCTGNLAADVTTGEVTVTDTVCRKFSSCGSTGDLSLQNVCAETRLCAERKTGDVILNTSDAEQISVKTTTGDVTGSLLSEKVFITETSAGSVDVPKNASGGKCEISTTTGDIRIVLAKP